MATGRRRGLPDNLDPLVDTLSNVVGILVIVIALTQIQVGDALDRVVALAARQAQEAGQLADGRSTRERGLDQRRDALFRRADAEPERARQRAETLLAALEALPDADERAGAEAEAARIEARLAEAEQTLARERTAIERRRDFAEALERVPPQQVARLPDPSVVRGRESWLLVRHGRVFLVDREALYEAGSDALEQILVGVQTPEQRRAALEDVDFYLRKKAVGAGRFRWRLEREPALEMRLVWEDLDEGIEPIRLDDDPALAAWLARRDPEQDVIVFQVWADSFAAYLAARERIEAAGFPASWIGYETDQEIRVPIRFGGRRPDPVGPIEID